MSGQYYLDPTCSTVTESEATLGGDEAHHFVRVMRGKVGDEIRLFDGKGLRFRGVVEMIRKTEIGVRIIETNSKSTESSVRLTVASALPKGERQKFLIEKLTELGVARFVPLRCERNVSKVDAAVLAKFRRWVIEASKQSLRTILMEIDDEKSLDEFGDFPGRKFLPHPVFDTEIGQTAFPNEIDGEVLVAVGPQGGFTPSETATALQCGFTPIDLGPRFLRTETACFVVASLLLHQRVAGRRG